MYVNPVKNQLLHYLKYKEKFCLDISIIFICVGKQQEKY